MTAMSIALQGTATETIRQLESAEACAQFYVDHVEAYDAVKIVWEHVQSQITLAGRVSGSIPTNGGMVLVQPSGYDVDLVVVKELAPECIKDVEQPQSEALKQINEAAAVLYERLSTLKHRPDFSELDAILRLSQPQTIEQVDGRKLQSVLGRGDERARQLIERKVKVANRWRITVRAPEGAKA